MSGNFRVSGEWSPCVQYFNAVGLAAGRACAMQPAKALPQLHSGTHLA